MKVPVTFHTEKEVKARIAELASVLEIPVSHLLGLIVDTFLQNNTDGNKVWFQQPITDPEPINSKAKTAKSATAIEIKFWNALERGMIARAVLCKAFKLAKKSKRANKDQFPELNFMLIDFLLSNASLHKIFESDNE